MDARAAGSEDYPAGIAGCQAGLVAYLSNMGTCNRMGDEVCRDWRFDECMRHMGVKAIARAQNIINCARARTI